MFFVESVDTCLVAHRPHFHEFAVEMEYLRAAGTFVEIVDILGDDIYVIPLFKFDKCRVGSVRVAFHEPFSTFVVKLVDEGRVACESVGAAYVHHRVVFPKAVSIAESRDS